MRRITIPLVLIWMTLIDSGSAQCSCYSFDGTPLRSWSVARHSCRVNQGDLVSMETREEWEFIKTQIQNRKTEPLGLNEWWIGLEKRDGNWSWLSNHSLTYNKWQEENRDPNKAAIHVIMAKNFPSDTYGLFRNKRDYLLKGTICEYKGKENCRSSLIRLRSCNPTTEPSSRSTTTLTNIPSQTTKFIQTTTETPGNHSPVPHHSTSSSSVGPVKDSRQSFPTEIVGSVIGVILLTTCIVILACIWKRRKQERKPRRNSHLSMKSRVPVTLEHSLSSNTNDLINSSDVTVVSDNALQPEPAYASVHDHRTDGTSKEKNKTWEEKQTNTNQSNMPNVIYAELNKPRQAATQNSYHGNKEQDTMSFENELTDYQNPHAQEEIQSEDNRLVYAQLADFKENEQQQTSTKMPSPYKETDYATIMTPILCNRSKSKENISQT